MDLILPNKFESPSTTANGIQFVQGGTFGRDGRLWLVGDDYQSTLYKIDTSTGRLVSSQALLIGNDVGGLEYVPAPMDALLVGLNREGRSTRLASESMYILRRGPPESCDCAILWEDDDDYYYMEKRKEVHYGRAILQNH